MKLRAQQCVAHSQGGYNVERGVLVVGRWTVMGGELGGGGGERTVVVDCATHSRVPVSLVIPVRLTVISLLLSFLQLFLLLGLLLLLRFHKFVIVIQNVAIPWPQGDETRQISTRFRRRGLRA